MTTKINLQQRAAHHDTDKSTHTPFTALTHMVQIAMTMAKTMMTSMFTSARAKMQMTGSRALNAT